MIVASVMLLYTLYWYWPHAYAVIPAHPSYHTTLLLTRDSAFILPELTLEIEEWLEIESE